MNNKAYLSVLLVVLCGFLLSSCVAYSRNSIITNGGNTIAILASGNISDFGYCYTVSNGRVKMEQNLNISGTLFADNINDPVTAFATMQDLVAQGYRLIISSTSSHGNASYQAAAMYPNVSFVILGGTSKLPNLSVLSFVGAELYYIAGVFAGALTSVNKVGFIHPNAPLAAMTTLNSFYVGVKTSNPDAEVYNVFTNSFDNPDRTNGAANILINETGVDMLVGQQDDFSLQQAAMAAGFLAVGCNGYALRNIFGEAIGFSVLKDWSGPFTTYAAGVLALADGEVFRKDITAGFSSGYTTLDTPSFAVPSEVWSEVLNQTAILKSGKKSYYCNQWVAELGGLNSTTGCLLSTTLYTNTSLSGINLKGTYLVPLDDIPFPKPTAVAVIVLACLLGVCTIIISGALYILRRDTVMLASSPLFLGLILIGNAMIFASTIAWVLAPTVAGCEARIWVPSIGFTLCVGAMVVKNARILLIFESTFKRIRIHDIKLLLWMTFMLIINVVLLAVWTSLGKPHVDVEQGIDTLGPYETRKLCATTLKGDKVLWAIIAFHCSQLALGCFVTFRIRIIDIEEFNESRPFGLCIYVATLVVVIAGILIGTGGTTSVQVIIIVAFAMLIGAAAVLFLLFFPKFLTIFVKGERPIEKIMKNISNKGSNGTKGSKGSGDKNDSDSGSVSATTAAASGRDSPAPTPAAGNKQIVIREV